MANELKAIEKIQQFGKALKVELQKGMKKSPVDAVKACNLQAPAIQKNVSTDNMQIGRVSFKNRSPNNKPEKWMVKYMKGFHKKSIMKPFITVKLDDGKMGLLKPIKTMPVCLKCHGEKISNNLEKEISRLYPQDKARGYKLGDIRGFFWVKY